MLRPQASALSPGTWQEKALDIVAPVRPRVHPGPRELLSQRFTAVTNGHLVFARTDQRSLGLTRMPLSPTPVLRAEPADPHPQGIRAFHCLTDGGQTEAGVLG